MPGMFKGKSNAEGAAPRSVLLDTSFRYNPERDDLEGIITPVATPDTSSVSTPIKSTSHTPPQSEDEDTENRSRNIQEPPIASPHTSNIRGFVSKLRKPHSKKETQKTIPKEPPKVVESEAKKNELGPDSGDSRSPSPNGEVADVSPVDNIKDGWFGGFRGKIAKKFEGSRSRSKSVPTSDVVDEEEEEVEKAEEADPEKMAQLQQESDKAEQFNELDDAWEKKEDPDDGTVFYKDFAAVKKRWRELDTAYLAEFSPDLLTLTTSVFGGVAATIVALMWLNLSSFLTGFVVASMCGWIYMAVQRFLNPPMRPVVLERKPNPDRNLLMPRPPDPEALEGWMNALPLGSIYDQRSHVDSACKSVYVQLKESSIRIRTAKHRMSGRAMWNDEHKDINSVDWVGKQWFIELEGATIRLQPADLSVGGRWDRKFPIVVTESAKSDGDRKQVFLFGRTSRDKEHWFALIKKTIDACDGRGEPILTNENPSKFQEYMAHVGSRPGERIHEAIMLDGKRLARQPSMPHWTAPFRETDTQWLNMFVGRMLFDIFTKPAWKEVISQKLQKVLNKTESTFVESLKLIDVDFGTHLPLIRRTSNAVHCPLTGTWIDLEVAYEGTFTMALQTNLNFKKFMASQQPQAAPKEQEMREMDKTAAFGDDDFVDDLDEILRNEDLAVTQATPSVLESVVKYASEYKLFQKGCDALAGLDLKAAVVLRGMYGRLALNIPPPPSDRIWYGFRSMPRLQLDVEPQMNLPDVISTKAARYIRSHILTNLQKRVIVPNMEDLDLKFMDGIL